MTHIFFIHKDGSEQQALADIGQSVMQVALSAMVQGITGDCGGACTCATCHGYVDEAWISLVPPSSVDELDMIDAACLNALPNSRLTCQIKVTAELDGLVIRIPPPH
jgi:2Fe-2S ferredoxin